MTPQPAARPGPAVGIGQHLTVARIFREHGAYVVRTVRRLGVEDRDVEDVAQEVFVVVHRRLEQYRFSASLRAWLFGIARRVVADHRKRAPRRGELARDGVVEPAGQAPAWDAELRLMEEALARLPAGQREVFVLFELEGMPMDEVAQAVGCALFTAYTRLRSARRRVRAHLQDALGQEKGESP